MKHLKNEKGSAAIFLLWIMTVIIVLSLLIVNIAKVYAVKQQASTAAQLGAFAATSEILFATEEAIKDFDKAMLETLGEGEEYEALWDEIEERKKSYLANGDGEQRAYIKALNEMLPGRLGDHILKGFFNAKFHADAALSTKIYTTVQRVVRENEGNDEHLEIIISKEKYRVEVKTDATYKTIASGEYINSFSKDIPQVGYGPELTFLRYILN
ncbi:Tad domain-containing protein [Ureibacillus chungkukjangi]|uniref:Putative Flp pilus-assembly TadE/G-like protein n=1 Tax=Ureibacillus chungkukjangi TaxID=1202712 RepID=A0A318TXB0_9BACL|nr:Tad domain-containing protein [Ureibacillus chungkukjangi]PYF07648.1 putative Flp pilus-assembly TadE/G-like protein [Ureibacillus chungkukjangi]